MNYYQHHIGDFNAGTVRFERLERWIYRDMIEVYYDTEQPLPADLNAICRKIGVRSEEERAIVQMLLDEKFTLEADGYHHARCDAEIAAYRAKSDSASKRGKLGGRPKKEKEKPQETYSFSVANQQDSNSQANETSSQANQEPITNNQEPDDSPSENKRVPRFNARKYLASKGVEEQNINDWLEVRKKKGQANTLSAMELTESEAAKAGISLNDAIRFSAQRSYAGFKAAWLQNEQSGERQSALDLAQQVQRAAGPRNPGGYVSKQEQLERNNRAVVERLAARLQAEQAAKGNDDETE